MKQKVYKTLTIIIWATFLIWGIQAIYPSVWGMALYCLAYYFILMFIREVWDAKDFDDPKMKL